MGILTYLFGGIGKNTQTLDKYDFLADANERFEVIRKNTRMARKALNKSNSFDLER